MSENESDDDFAILPADMIGVQPSIFWKYLGPGVADVFASGDHLMFLGHRLEGKIGLPAVSVVPRDEPHVAIALLNDFLDDGDPRKITREWVSFLRSAAVHAVSCASFDDANPSTAECDCGGPTRAGAIADALQSYLPPEASERASADD